MYAALHFNQYADSNSYGTVLVDMDTHRPIDLLDGRTADDLATWLRDHPGVQVICRDRAGSYADGAREGAPEATQVADRFHLWQNLATALEKTIRSHRSCLQEVPGHDTTLMDDIGSRTEPVQEPMQRPKTLDSYNERPMVARTHERHAQVQALRAKGLSLNAISRELGLAFRTIRKYANATSADELLAAPFARSSKLDEFKPYRIVIAEDDALLREGLTLLLRAEALDVVATASDAVGFLTAIDAHEPDVAIVDVRMPPTHTDEGIVAAVEARRRLPGLAVLVLSAYVEQAFATDLLSYGSSRLGYLLKERVGRVQEFMTALHRVAGGGTAIDPEVVAQLLTRSRPGNKLERLSPREHDVLALMAEGLGNAAIAERLFVTGGAVHKHIRSIFAKLDLAPADGTDRRVAAALRYLENA
ncbi:response regulator [Nonomuraea phyllanthi]|uniref:Response regulator n=1 Tax=Nonomuraea phyllanthi TaxID=2219224 RepID=A0A5C4V0S3_9ACTN|nr:response regulator [Nonomuraea phyllanthi]QFY09330.1 response regulator [Nonomuraea phyllanthi]